MEVTGVGRDGGDGGEWRTPEVDGGLERTNERKWKRERRRESGRAARSRGREAWRGEERRGGASGWVEERG